MIAKFNTSATPSTKSSGGGGLITILIGLGLIGAGWYFFHYLPSKKEKEAKLAAEKAAPAA